MKLSELVLSHGDKTESTSYPIWFIAQKVRQGHVILSRGIWFNRQDAERYLSAHAYNFPKNAIVWCGSGHESWHVKELYAMAKAEAGVQS